MAGTNEERSRHPADLLGEQVEYYRARAPEYEQWFRRQGRYSRGPEANARWFAEFAVARDRLREFDARGDVLEIACGTGQTTSILAESATRLTALDAAPEMIDEARRRPELGAVDFVQQDVFEWKPPRSFDSVVFTFWLSHVPAERFEPFWRVVGDVLAPGGRVFFADSLYAPWATAIDHELEGPDAGSVTRRLNDGREFRIVKRFFDPSGLGSELRAIGWNIEVRATGELLLTGSGRPDTADGGA
jgi:demethylmenaquinone methyltransferase/2-methoxy-6-polyprenyl-1,4-benzoquinol methylase